MAPLEREETDKVGWEHATPLTEDAVTALRLAEGRANGHHAWLFPSPQDPELPCSAQHREGLVDRAQEAAGLGHVSRLGWHSLRRKFANDLRAA